MYCKHCGHEIPVGTEACLACGKSLALAPIVAAPATASVLAASGFEVASMGKRFLSYLIDDIIIIIFGVLLGYFILNHAPIAFVTRQLFGVILSCIYFILFEYFCQRTPGKYLVKTKVVSRDGDKPALKNIVGRTFARCIPFDALSFLRKNPIGWHDNLSATLVVPVSYTAEEVKKIDLTRKQRSVWIIIVIVVGAIVLIGILATLGIVALSNAREKSRDAERLRNVNDLGTALNLYYKDAGAYPTELRHGNKLSYKDKVYLNEVPSNPISTGDSSCPNKDDYDYVASIDHKSYSIIYCLESDTDTMKAGTHRVTPQGIDK